MTVSTLAGIAAILSRTQVNQAARGGAALNSLFSQGNTGKPASADTGGLSAAITLQNQVAQFRVASQNVAQASSVLAAAEAGAVSISRDVARLEDVAARAASSGLPEQERVDLSTEFSIVRRRIDATARSTKFNNEALLDGSSAQILVARENRDLKDLTVGSLTDQALFKGVNLSIATPEAAKATREIIRQAQAYIGKQIATIRSLQTGLDFTAATLESAIQNQDAARSTLDDADFTTQLLGGTSPLAGNNIGSLFAQTNRLPPSMLQLLTE